VRQQWESAILLLETPFLHSVESVDDFFGECVAADGFFLNRSREKIPSGKIPAALSAETDSGSHLRRYLICCGVFMSQCALTATTLSVLPATVKSGVQTIAHGQWYPVNRDEHKAGLYCGH
jgi:hypothetical protein